MAEDADLWRISSVGDSKDGSCEDDFDEELFESLVVEKIDRIVRSLESYGIDFVDDSSGERIRKVMRGNPGIVIEFGVGDEDLTASVVCSFGESGLLNKAVLEKLYYNFPLAGPEMGCRNHRAMSDHLRKGLAYAKDLLEAAEELNGSLPGNEEKIFELFPEV